MKKMNSKKILAFCLALSFSLTSYSQQQLKEVKLQEMERTTIENNHNCGTPAKTEAQMRYTLDVIDKMAATRNAGTTALPIRIHIIRMDDGTGGIDMEDVNIGLSYLNYYYKEIGAEFFIASVNYIDDTDWYDFDSADEATMTAAHSTYDAINIYFANTVTSSGTAACGYAYYPSNLEGTLNILMRNSCTAAYENGTLVHELGHFFDVAHTHNGTSNGNGHSNAENVARTGANANCSTKGDLLCDTEADPNGSNDGSCNFVNDGNSTEDVHSETYTPDIDNIMSYYSDACGGVFTAGQYTRMVNGLATRMAHSNYTLNGASSMAVTDPTGVTASLNNAYGMDVSWTDNASNETGYLIERSADSGTTWQQISGGAVTENVTTFTDISLESNNTYSYRVKASNDDINDYSTASTDVAVGILYCVPTTSSNVCTASANAGANIYSFLLEETSGTDLILNDDNGCVGGLSVFSDTYNAAVTAGNTYNFTASFVNPANSTYVGQQLKIWVDANGNGDFEDTGELLFTSSSDGPSISGSITLPTEGINGVTTLRVRSKYSSAPPDPCGYTIYSETEDYGLTISGALPVELISFTGEKKGREVKLEWSTASEENNDYFVIERSANGRDFKRLGQKEGEGTTSEIVNYTLMDESPLVGLNYYRMVQVDYDGKRNIQDHAVVVDFGLERVVSVFPNPTKGDLLQMHYFSEQRSNFQLAIYDLGGNLRFSQQYVADRGDNNIMIDIPGYAPGVYLIKLFREEEMEVIRFVKGK